MCSRLALLATWRTSISCAYILAAPPAKRACVQARNTPLTCRMSVPCVQTLGAPCKAFMCADAELTSNMARVFAVCADAGHASNMAMVCAECTDSWPGKNGSAHCTECGWNYLGTRPDYVQLTCIRTAVVSSWEYLGNPSGVSCFVLLRLHSF